jgi:hypothetical protein
LIFQEGIIIMMDYRKMNFDDIDQNNKEQVGAFIQQLPKTEKKQMDEMLQYFLPIWLENKVKEKTVHNLPEEDRRYLFQIILLTSFTDRGKFGLFSNKERLIQRDVAVIVDTIKNGNSGKISDLIAIFEKNAQVVKEVFVNQIEEYKLKHLSKEKKKQVGILQKREGKEKVIKEIVNNFYKKDKKVKILHDSVEQFNKNVELIDLSIYTPKALQINERLIPMIVSLISNPSCLLPQNAVNILRDVDVPNGWYAYHVLTIGEYRELCENLSDPKQWNYIAGKVCTDIKTKLSVPIDPIKKRKQIITEILDSLEDRRFEIARISMYAEIEGLLWDLSIEVHKTDSIFDESDENGKSFLEISKNEVFETTRIREVLERTALKNHVDIQFIRDFCDCIYEERNPILHGRQNCFAECKKNWICLIQKLMALEYVMGLIVDEFQRNLFNQWNNMPSEVIERLVKSYTTMMTEDHLENTTSQS